VKQKLEQMKISPEKAEMLLEAMRNQEKQYLQQNKRKATKPKGKRETGLVTALFGISISFQENIIAIKLFTVMVTLDPNNINIHHIFTMKEVYVISAVRTPIGSFGGS
jgi:hypothetical protein